MQCLDDFDVNNNKSVFNKSLDNNWNVFQSNVSNVTTTLAPIIPFENPCIEPWSYAPNQVLPTLWRIVYWTAQVLTWIVLPLMQSYSMAGEFTVIGKLRAAFIENAIYYGIFAIIFVIFIIYVSIKTALSLEGLKIICITASNTWGLFLLVVLLGYGLVEIPRSCFNNSYYGRTLSYLYFKVAKLSAEKCESEEKLEDVLDEIQTCLESLNGERDPMRPYLDIIVNKCPEQWKQQMMTRLTENRVNSVSYSGNAYNEKSLTRMHKSIIQTMQTNHRTHCQWDVLISQAIQWEDVAKNEVSPTRIYRSTIETRYSSSSLMSRIINSIYTPRVEWYWKCMYRSTFYRGLGYVLTLFSLMVVWSEMTFSLQSIPLSIFALIMKVLRSNYSYFLIEVSFVKYLILNSFIILFVRRFRFYRSLISAFVRIIQYLRSEYLITTIWHLIIKQMNTVLYSAECKAFPAFVSRIIIFKILFQGFCVVWRLLFVSTI